MVLRADAPLPRLMRAGLAEDGAIQRCSSIVSKSTFLWKSMGCQQQIPTTSDRKSRVVVFGNFYSVHDGRRDFFRQAREYGDELILIVGRDRPARSLKSKAPRYSEGERIELVGPEPGVGDVVLGDEEISSYRVRESNPDAMTSAGDVVCRRCGNTHLLSDGDELLCPICSRRYLTKRVMVEPRPRYEHSAGTTKWDKL